MRASAIRFPQGRSAGVPASYSLGSKLGECFTAYMVLVPLLLSVAAAAVQTPMDSAPPPQTNTPHHSRRLFISPMGEPFRSNSRDDDTLADWFQQADRNHDGKLTLEEMQQDAERFFAFLDVNHDGEIDPDEITRYESEIAPEVRTREDFAAELAGSGDGEHSDRERGGQSREGGHRRGGDGGGGFFHSSSVDARQGAARFGLLDLPEPVAAADADFNRGVSLTEFRAAAQRRFLALDVDHKGYLTLDVLETIRPAPPPTGNPPDTTAPASSDQSY